MKYAIPKHITYDTLREIINDKRHTHYCGILCNDCLLKEPLGRQPGASLGTCIRLSKSLTSAVLGRLIEINVITKVEAMDLLLMNGKK